MCATTSRVRQPSQSDGASHTAGSAASNRSASARYSPATLRRERPSAVVASDGMAVPPMDEVRPVGHQGARETRARYASKRSSEDRNPAWTSGGGKASGTYVWWIRTSVRSGPSATNSVDDPHARVRLGPRQQLGRPHLVVDRPGGVSLPSCVVDHHGLEDAARAGVDRDAVARCAVPAGPQKCVRWSGSVMQRKTSSRGASKTRVKRSSRGGQRRAHRTAPFPLRSRRGVPLEVGQQRIELVEALVPDAPVRR